MPTIKSICYIAGWLSETETTRLFLCPDIQKNPQEYPTMGRKGSEIYAIYCAGSRAGSKADGLIDLSQKL